MWLQHTPGTYLWYWKEKFPYTPPKKSASNFCDLFQFTLSLIFTRPVAIWPFFVVFCFSILAVHTVNSPNLPPPTHGGGGCIGGHSGPIWAFRLSNKFNLNICYILHKGWCSSMSMMIWMIEIWSKSNIYLCHVSKLAKQQGFVKIYICICTIDMTRSKMFFGQN